jgi:peptide/nickel transport system substrate-binding protein
LSLEELVVNESANRYPIGWGAYMMEEWVAGDHITLAKNPLYFRGSEGLPVFDRLVYRFVSTGQEALQALAVGECDFADSTTMIDPFDPQLAEFQNKGSLFTYPAAGGAWEQLLLGITPFQPSSSNIFNSQEMRRAAALCIDRESLANVLYPGLFTLPKSYVTPSHPLYSSEAQEHPFDPEQSKLLLESRGWVDHDNDPSTPRIAQGVPGTAAGTPLEFTYLTSNETLRQRAAEIIQESLEGCGFGVNLVSQSIQDLLAAGPEGPVFGRSFTAAQFGWNATLEPPCALYLSQEIPGPYPAYPKGWGGANAAGFSSDAFDAACLEALSSFDESEGYARGHRLAQDIYAEQLPSIPLYFYVEIEAARPDLCGFTPDPSAFTSLWNLESLGYGNNCPVLP